jgi:nicotinamide mononucleotide transporter
MLELVAVVLAIIYLLLASKEKLSCWYFYFVSSLIYSVIFWDVSLLMESMLNIFYVIMAVVGWQQWRYGGNDHHGIAIKSLALWQHAVIISGVLVMAAVNGWFLQQNTSAAFPYLDSFTTWASIVTTFLMIRKILENWLYWIVIDVLSIYLYLDRGLSYTAMLFAVYVLIAAFGYFSWRKVVEKDSLLSL